ncbi:hypothetical protein TL16_g04840 [Triparma laevis f. inornata]|uniref:Sulfatase N-terminal domain-containing protein n=1 Tax=Triparma laevis f. inornata TaxID=1714386 RepID=A0A9W7E767_9STRA|nr:hypothetical protein TL16_g04840 [Triparma laevis f. inornata]
MMRQPRLFVLFLSLALSTTFSVAGKHPNILLLLSDDLGYDELSSFGQQSFSTPNIDRLAASGIRFTDAYTGAPVCAPSRGVLMTGLHTGHAYIRGNNGNADGTDMHLRANDTTLPELLQSNGYHTSLFGKWGLGFNDTEGAPNVKGFDKFYGELDQANAHNMYPPFLWRDTEKEDLIGNVETKPSRERCMVANSGCNWTHDIFTQNAIEELENRAAEPEKPFFMFLSWTDPHAGGYTTTNAETGNPVPSAGDFANEADWPAVEQDHASVIQNYQDDSVGVILKLLDDLKLTNDTIVFFASDNGASNEGGLPETGFHSYNFFNSSGLLTGCKRSLYEGGIRSPTIVRWPGVVEEGVVSDFPWGFEDFLPTVLEIAGAEDVVKSNNFDGTSIVPVLQGGGGDRDRCLYFEFCTNINGVKSWGQAVRIGDYKAVTLSSEADLELYNLRKDPSEQVNLAGGDGVEEIMGNLKDCLEREHVDSEDFPKGDGVCRAS